MFLPQITRELPELQKMSYYANKKSIFVMIKIAFILFPKTHLLDFAGPAQVFYEANQLGKSHFQLCYASVTDTIATAQTPVFHQLQPIDTLQLQAGDLICLPGIDFKSFQQGELDSIFPQCKAWMWRQREKGVFISSICTGALMLGRLGLLDHIQYTTHWKCVDYVKQQFPKGRLIENRLYCFDRGIFTSAGMTSGIDMALALVEQWVSPLLAAKIAQEMVINIRRAETQEQKNVFLDFKNHFNADVYKAQELLANRLHTRFTIEDLARELNLSSRHLARLYKKHTGQTLQAYRDKLRVDYGEQLLLNSERSIKEIAIACGFENTRQFIRLWKREKGCTPGQFRTEKTHTASAKPAPEAHVAKIRQ